MSEHPILARNRTKSLTYYHLEKGLSIEEIANVRHLKVGTVEDHLAKLYAEGYPIAIRSFLPLDAEVIIREVIHKAGPQASLKTLYDLLFGQYSYLAIKLTQAKMERERVQL